MRDRDAIDTERKNLQATYAKQNQVLDHIRGLNKVIQENHVSNDSPKKICAELMLATEHLRTREYGVEGVQRPSQRPASSSN